MKPTVNPVSTQYKNPNNPHYPIQLLSRTVAPVVVPDGIHGLVPVENLLFWDMNIGEVEMSKRGSLNTSFHSEKGKKKGVESSEKRQTT